MSEAALDTREAQEKGLEIIEAMANKGITNETYIEQWDAKVALPLKGLTKDERKYVFYARYNKERTAGVNEAYEMSAELASLIDSVTEKQHWMVLTENWCSDSSYSLPIISQAALRNPVINMRILLRDDNLDVMDQYLTNGGRSIPKLVVFGEDGKELFQWGPRPAALTALRAQLVEEGMDGGKISQKMMEAYEAGAWKEVEQELIDALKNIASLE